MTELSGKRALVTGAARGIGAAIALELARRGADVAITFKQAQARADDLVHEIETLGRRAFAIKADSADADDVKRSIDEAATLLGGLDIIVNNAGVLHYGKLEDMPLEAIDEILNVNVRGMILSSRAAIPHLPDGGRIISIGSCLAERVSITDVSVYSMSKSALLSLTRGLARDLGPRGITVNLVHPGPTDTDMNPKDGEGAEELRRQIPLGRYGEAQDVTAAVAFLASPAARHITGSGLSVDGGINA
jgi:3-oxoacyl-[acyl-carrier protein] reductase